MTFEKIKGQRDVDLLIHNDFIYNASGEDENGLRWRCQDRTCRGFLVIDNFDCITEWNYHKHPEVSDKIAKLRILNAIKEKALTTTERANDIIIREISAIPSESIVLSMPNITTMCDSIRRLRNTRDGIVPGDAEDIPEILKVDQHGDPFFRYDSGIRDPDRFVLFFSKLKGEYTKFVETGLIDGTFRSTPQNFYQILVVHGQILGNYYPLCYILLKNKTQASYEKSLRKYVELSKIEFKTIISDFELGLINGISQVFDTSTKNGCLFHFGQAVWRRVSSDKNTKLYKNNSVFKKYILYMMHLAFVPSESVKEYYILIKNKIKEKAEQEEADNKDLESPVNINNNERSNNIFKILLGISDYFERTWVGIYNDTDDLIKPPMFPIEFWNVNQRILAFQPRTSNAAESWNRTLNFRTEVAHPNIAQFITELLRGEEAHKYNIQRAETGIFKVSKEDSVREKKIFTAVSNFKAFKPFVFLDIISKNFKFKLD